MIIAEKLTLNRPTESFHANWMNCELSEVQIVWDFLNFKKKLHGFSEELFSRLLENFKYFPFKVSMNSFLLSLCMKIFRLLSIRNWWKKLGSLTFMNIAFLRKLAILGQLYKRQLYKRKQTLLEFYFGKKYATQVWPCKSIKLIMLRSFILQRTANQLCTFYHIIDCLLTFIAQIQKKSTTNT